MPSMVRFHGRFLWITLIGIILDRVSKKMALYYLTPYQPKVILPIFNLTLAFNRGAAFGFLNSADGWQTIFFSVLALFTVILLLYWLFTFKQPQTLPAIAISLIIAGALGNLWDRLQFGHVIDYFQVHYLSWFFPIFNVADSLITVGTILFVLSCIKYDAHS